MIGVTFMYYNINKDGEKRDLEISERERNILDARCKYIHSD